MIDRIMNIDRTFQTRFQVIYLIHRRKMETGARSQCRTIWIQAKIRLAYKVNKI